MASAPETVKDKARRLLDNLPDRATWDEVVYELAVRRSIEQGLIDAKAGQLTDSTDVRREFGVE